MTLADTVFSGQLLVAIPIALLAGLVSFVSPCVLPLVPGYLGYVGAWPTRLRPPASGVSCSGSASSWPDSPLCSSPMAPCSGR
jgi:hypothetical protein